MKQLVLTIAVALAAIAPPCMAAENPTANISQEMSSGNNPAEKTDTILTYTIDGQHIKHFTGKELEGKTIKQYDIRHTFVSEDNVVIETHIIKTTTPLTSNALEPHYIVEGKEISKNEFYRISSTKIKAISVFKAGSKGALQYGKDGDNRNYIVITLKK